MNERYVITLPNKLPQSVRYINPHTGTLVHWYTGTLVHWYTGSLVHWYTVSSVVKLISLIRSESNT